MTPSNNHPGHTNTSADIGNAAETFIMNASERERILRDFNNTAAPLRKEASLVQLLQEQVALRPDSIALVFEGHQITYREFDERSNRWAHYLKSKGVGKESLVAFCLTQSLEKIVCMLAILKTGGAYVPLETNHPKARLEYMLEDSKAAVLLTSTTLEETFTSYSGLLINIDNESTIAAVESQPADLQIPVIDPQHLIYVIYTSGTTGKPKGVMVEHEQVSNFLQCYGAYLQLDATARALQFTSTGFDASATDLWLPLVTGAALYLYPNNRIMGEGLWQYITQHNITALPFIAPSVLATLPANEDLAALKLIGVGGEVCPETVVKKWKDRVRLVNVYGPTEATIAVSSFVYDDAHPTTTIGYPNANCSFYILDAGMQVVPVGQTGELYIGGAQVARGYLNLPELTREKFFTNPFAGENETGNGWKRLYRTGDMARYLPDGRVEFLGRTDSQVKIRGVRIELGEIENVLLNQPGIKQAAVIVHEDKYDERTLIACIIHEKGKLKGDLLRQTNDTLRKALQAELPSQMVPSSFLFLERLPVNAHGKIDKSALNLNSREIIEAVFPEGVSFNECEQVIKAIWCEVLQRKDVTIQDNFFELGGHSILLTQVYKRLPPIFRAKLTLPHLFDYQTIEHLAAQLRSGLTADEKAMKLEEDPNYLISDVYLSPDIKIEGSIHPEVIKNPKAIFLTGATGFVGSHLLAELLASTNADIYCHVRAEDEQAAMERIRLAFKHHAIPDSHLIEERIRPVPGDLSHYKLGISDAKFDELCKIIDVIYHSGSSVSYIEPYNYMKGSNVGGLNEIIRLASTHKLKLLTLLSTVAVFAWGSYDSHQHWISEEDSILPNLKYVKQDLGYAKTKWVMEQICSLAASKGLPTVLFRLGFVMCHSKTGACGLDQMWAMLVKHCVNLKAFPLLLGIKEELTTADYVCKAMVNISKQPNAIGKKFHLTPSTENDLSWVDFFTRLKHDFGFELKPVMYHEWLDMWSKNENDIFYPYLSLLTDDVIPGQSLAELYQYSYHYLCHNTTEFLKGSGIEPPRITNEILEAYLNYLKIPVPEQAEVAL